MINGSPMKLNSFLLLLSYSLHWLTLESVRLSSFFFGGSKLVTLFSLINMETRLLILIFFGSPPPMSIDFLDVFNHPLLIYCIIVFTKKIPPSTFNPASLCINSGTFAPPPQLFQPAGLLERWEWIFYQNWIYSMKIIVLC